MSFESKGKNLTMLFPSLFLLFLYFYKKKETVKKKVLLLGCHKYNSYL